MGQRRGNDFDDDGDVDETTKDRNVVEIKVMERGRANNHNIDDGCPPSVCSCPPVTSELLLA